MKNVPARIVLVVGISALVFALGGLFNSSLDSRVTLLIAVFGSAIAVISVGARRAFETSQHTARIVLVAGISALVFALVGLFNSIIDSRVTLLVALFGVAVGLISVGARSAFRTSNQTQSALVM